MVLDHSDSFHIPSNHALLEWTALGLAVMVVYSSVNEPTQHDHFSDLLI